MSKCLIQGEFIRKNTKSTTMAMEHMVENYRGNLKVSLKTATLMLATDVGDEFKLLVTE